MFLAVDIAFIHGEMWVRGAAYGGFILFPEAICGGGYSHLDRSTSTAFVQIDALSYEPSNLFYPLRTSRSSGEGW